MALGHVHADLVTSEILIGNAKWSVRRTTTVIDRKRVWLINAKTPAQERVELTHVVKSIITYQSALVRKVITEMLLSDAFLFHRSLCDDHRQRILAIQIHAVHIVSVSIGMGRLRVLVKQDTLVLPPTADQSALYHRNVHLIKRVTIRSVLIHVQEVVAEVLSAKSSIIVLSAVVRQV